MDPLQTEAQLWREQLLKPQMLPLAVGSWLCIDQAENPQWTIL